MFRRRSESGAGGTDSFKLSPRSGPAADGIKSPGSMPEQMQPALWELLLSFSLEHTARQMVAEEVYTIGDAKLLTDLDCRELGIKPIGKKNLFMQAVKAAREPSTVSEASSHSGFFSRSIREMLTSAAERDAAAEAEEEAAEAAAAEAAAEERRRSLSEAPSIMRNLSDGVKSLLGGAPAEGGTPHRARRCPKCGLIKGRDRLEGQSDKCCTCDGI